MRQRHFAGVVLPVVGRRRRCVTRRRVAAKRGVILTRRWRGDAVQVDDARIAPVKKSWLHEVKIWTERSLTLAFNSFQVVVFKRHIYWHWSFWSAISLATKQTTFMFLRSHNYQASTNQVLGCFHPEKRSSNKYYQTEPVPRSFSWLAPLSFF